MEIAEVTRVFSLSAALKAIDALKGSEVLINMEIHSVAH